MFFDDVPPGLPRVVLGLAAMVMILTIGLAIFQ
jgi:hypothetical protein